MYLPSVTVIEGRHCPPSEIFYCKQATEAQGTTVVSRLRKNILIDGLVKSLQSICDHSDQFNENKCQCQAFYKSAFTRRMIVVAGKDLAQLPLMINA